VLEIYIYIKKIFCFFILKSQLDFHLKWNVIFQTVRIPISELKIKEELLVLLVTKVHRKKSLLNTQPTSYLPSKDPATGAG